VPPGACRGKNERHSRIDAVIAYSIMKRRSGPARSAGVSEKYASSSFSKSFQVGPHAIRFEKRMCIAIASRTVR
jgi:hypothetical protein